ncbi:hypothetical protein B0T17DRAFT_657363 [Bombardia bombarda]|uniref:Fungal N-terminal domain-containing protein n=1 Tax=Bombardia bombarda TaxID=252184 RepID=A0AA39WGR9_9PEZI|nr:hypothetical protein B0T17DRAFT_657363 [Bombardia bombarda]
MADPLSVAGLAAGLVSLGLQVYEGLTNYLDAIKGREEEVASISRQANALKASLEMVDRSIQSAGPIRSQVDNDTVAQCLEACRRDLKLLEDEVATVKLPPAPQAGTTLGDKAKETVKVLSYPGHRSRMKKVEERVQVANKTLQIALQTMGLDLSLTILNTLSTAQPHPTVITGIDGVKQDTSKALVLLQGSHQSLQSMNNGITTVTKDTSEVLLSVRGVQHSLQPIGDDINSIKTDTSNVLHSIQGMVPLLESQTKAFSEQLQKALSEQLQKEFEVIRQVVDNVAPMIEATVMKSQNDQYERLERLLSLPVAQQHRPRDIASLVSKPATLQSLCDSMQTISPPSTNVMNLSRRLRCTCRPRRVVKNSAKKLGPFQIFYRNQASLTHYEWCDFAGINPPEKSHHVGVAYVGLVRLLRTAVSVTFQLKHGAGGVSLSPGIACYTMVDRRTSPAFQIMELWHNAQEYIEEAEERAELLTAVKTRIRHLYRSGKAGPLDIDQYNETILHRYASTLTRTGFVFSILYHRDTSATLLLLELSLEFIIEIMNYGVLDSSSELREAFVSDFISAFFRYHINFRNNDTVLFHAFDLTLSLVPKGSISVGTPVFRWPDTAGIEIPHLFSRYPTLIEVTNCNPLIIAVLQRNLTQIKEIARAASSLAFESHLHRFSALHYAVHYPEGLEAILDIIEHAYPLPRYIPGNKPQGLFEFAAEQSYMLCSEKRRNISCSDCTCSESTEILLSHYWYGDSMDWDKMIAISSRRTIQAILQHLKESRINILGMLLERPKDKEYNPAQVNEDELMTMTNRDVLDIINGQVFPSHIQGKVNAVLSSLSLYRNLFKSYIWNRDLTLPLSDLIWDFGFRDVFTPNIRRSGVYYRRGLPLTDADRPTVLAWLLRHGANVHLLLEETDPEECHDAQWFMELCPPQSGWLVAHRTADLLGCWLRTCGSKYLPLELESLRHVYPIICGPYLPDKCVCACSTGGCTPFLLTIRRTVALRRFDRPNTCIFDTVLRLISRLKFMGDLGGQAFSAAGQYLEALRYLTSETLGIRHTCCCSIIEMKYDPRDGYLKMTAKKPYDEEEAEEIREEDSELIESLSKLMEDFSQISFSSEESFWLFLDNDWKSRMLQVMDDLRQKEAQEGRKAVLQNMGVSLVLGCEESEDSDTDREYNKSDMQYWIKKIDEIVPLGDSRADA